MSVVAGLCDAKLRQAELPLARVLDCGVLERGCLRLEFRHCRHSELVAFSCKGRGFCPSCIGRRMCDLGVHLEREVLPNVPIGHWICSLPWGLRALLGYDSELCGEVLGAFVHEVSRSLRWRAKKLHGVSSMAEAQTGCVGAIQRVDSALRLNVHYRILALGGVYVADEQSLRFLPLPTPTRAEVTDIARRTANRIEKILRAHGRSLDPDPCEEPVRLQLEHPVLAACHDAAARGIAVSGDRAGQPTLRLITSPDSNAVTVNAADEPVAEVCGINVYAKHVVDGENRWQVERLCRYITRPPVAQDRLTRGSDGMLELALRHPWKDGSRALIIPRHPFATRFADIVAWDSSLVQVDDSLKAVFKGTRGAAASVKVVLGISIWGMLPLVAQIVAGHRHDMLLGPCPEHFRKGTLLLLDKGFVAYEHLRKLGESGLYYLCPMRSNGGPPVVGVNTAPANARKAIKAAKRCIPLRELLPSGKKIGKTWDVEVVIRAKTKGAQPFRARLVIVPGPNGDQRPYLTNLTQESPQVLRELYRLRWQIELVFKELKQDLNLTAVPTTDPNAVLALVWASLIALALSRTVAHWLNPLHEHCGLDAPFRLSVVTRALRAQMPLLCRLLSLPLPRARELLEFFREQLALEAKQAARGREDSLKRLKILADAA